MRTDRWMLLLLATLLLGACATTPVQPGTRAAGALGHAFDPDPMKSSLKEHTRFSKEGSSGRIGAAGGGCGCNR